MSPKTLLACAVLALGGAPVVVVPGCGNNNPDAGGKGDGGVVLLNQDAATREDANPCVLGATTTITGHIYDPAGNNPLYKVVAYIPGSDPDPIADGINGASCSCNSLYSGDPLATAISDSNGSFTIENAPDGTNVPIIIQIGKWRNYFTIPAVTKCVKNDLDELLPAKLTLPKTQNETKFSNIPSIAISTGQADSLECLLVRVGVSPDEYTGDPTNTTAHIHIFAGTPVIDGGVPNTDPPGPRSSGMGGLWDTDDDINRYDIVLLSCEGSETGNPNSAVLADFVNAGGRVFASHYHYAFFYNDQLPMPAGAAAQFPNVADWTLAYDGANDGGSDDYATSITATLETTLADAQPFPEGTALAGWLNTVEALSNGSLPVVVARHDAVVAPTNVSTVWAASAPGVTPPSSQYFSFDMPFDAGLDDAGQPNYCGRVVYSDLHVGAGEGDYGCVGNANDCLYAGTTPTGCHQGRLLSDEDAIEFILFDLSSCVTPVTGAPTAPIPK